MSTATIERVVNNVREFDTKHGRKASFRVYLAGEEQSLEVTTNADSAAAKIAEFEALVGKPSEFVIEDGGTFPSGDPKPKRLKLPGDPSNRSGGGAPAYRNTQEGFHEEQDFMMRRTALMSATEVHAASLRTPAISDLYGDTNRMYEWLKDPASPPAVLEPLSAAGEQVSSEQKTPADADRGLASEAGAPPTSSAATEAAGTEAGGARQEPSGHGEGPAGSEENPQPPTSTQERIASLWKQLDEYTGSRRKALNEVTRITKRSFKAGRDEHLVTEEELALTLSTVLKEAG